MNSCSLKLDFGYSCKEIGLVPHLVPDLFLLANLVFGCRFFVVFGCHCAYLLAMFLESSRIALRAVAHLL